MVMKGLYFKFLFLSMPLAPNTLFVDKQNGHMMGIFDDKVETIEAEAQMKPFNLAQLN